MGSATRDGSINTVNDAIDHCQPRGVVAVGIAFGGYTDKLKIADVLISTRVISYESARVQAGRDEPRGAQPEAGALLLNRFRNVIGWRFERPDGRSCDKPEGPLLSGEKLVDDLDFKTELFVEYPHALGGEMEASGVYASASRHNVEWIVVKGVCDWADGTKNDSHRLVAAAAAASLVEHVLGQAGVVADLPAPAFRRRIPRPRVEKELPGAALPVLVVDTRAEPDVARPTRTPLVYWIVQVTLAIVAGIIAIGTLLDALGNAAALITFPWALTITAVILIGGGSLEVIARTKGVAWPGRDSVAVKRTLGTRTHLGLFGVLVLAWLSLLIPRGSETTHSQRALADLDSAESAPVDAMPPSTERTHELSTGMSCGVVTPDVWVTCGSETAAHEDQPMRLDKPVFVSRKCPPSKTASATFDGSCSNDPDASTMTATFSSRTMRDGSCQESTATSASSSFRWETQLSMTAPSRVLVSVDRFRADRPCLLIVGAAQLSVSAPLHRSYTLGGPGTLAISLRCDSAGVGWATAMVAATCEQRWGTGITQLTIRVEMEP